METKGAEESGSFLHRPWGMLSGDSHKGGGVGEEEGTRGSVFWAARAAALARELFRVLRRLGWVGGATLGLGGSGGGRT